MGNKHNAKSGSKNGAGRRPFSDEEIQGLKIDWRLQGLVFCVCAIGLYASGYWSGCGALELTALAAPALVCLAASHAACFLSVRETMSMLGLPGLTVPAYADGCLRSAVMTTATLLLVLLGGSVAGAASDPILKCIGFALLAGICAWGFTVPAAFAKRALEAASAAIERIESLARNGQLEEELEKRRED